MPSLLNEALEWLDRAEQAREVAGQLTDPDARKAVLSWSLPTISIGSPRAAATPAVFRRRELATKPRKKFDDLFKAFLSRNTLLGQKP